MSTISRTRIWGWFRAFLISQQTFVFTAVVVYAALYVLQIRTPLTFGQMILLVVCTGNLIAPLVLLIGPIIRRVEGSWIWVVFLPFQAIVSGINSVLAAGVLFLLLAQREPFMKVLRMATPPTAFCTFAFGCVVFYHEQRRRQLKEKAERLEVAVAQGTVALQEKEQELIRAREIQQALLPKTLPQLPGAEVAGAWQPARTVSGDYFDVIRLDDQRLGICIADVAGKGITAALLMANLQAAFRAFASAEASPATVCSRLNTFVCGNIAPGKFITFLYAILDVQQRTLTYENAGHCPVLLLRPRGTVDALSGNGAVLGILPGWEYRDHTVQLERGDRLVFYTDGVTEAQNSSETEFSEERLIRAATDAGNDGAMPTQQRIMSEVASFCESVFSDDATLIVVFLKEAAAATS